MGHRVCPWWLGYFLASPVRRLVQDPAAIVGPHLRQGMTVLDLMIVVGGLTDFADGNNASILRTSEGGHQYSVRLKDLLKRGDISANVDVKPGDILLIPQSWF